MDLDSLHRSQVKINLKLRLKHINRMTSKNEFNNSQCVVSGGQPMRSHSEIHEGRVNGPW